MNKNNDRKTQCIITRKFTLIPEVSDRKEWVKRVLNYVIEECDKKIEYFEKKQSGTSQNVNGKITEKIQALQLKKELAKSGKLEIDKKLAVDYTYDTVRRSMKSEAARKNYILSWAFSEMKGNGVSYMEPKERKKFIEELLKPAYRKKGSKLGSLFDDTEIENILKSYGVAFSKSFTEQLRKDVANGLLDGEISLRTYKSNSPFTIAKEHISLTHNYETYEELRENIGKKDCKLYFNFGGNGIPATLRFLINTGTAKNKDELNTTLLKLYSGEYELSGSSIQLDKTGKKIILNLSMKIPMKYHELDENTVVGVDLGVAIPAVCALNNDMYKREVMGSADDFLRVRTKIQAQRRRLQSSLKYNSGGHGRKKKLKALERLSKSEIHFVETYNHMVSRRVVDFAIKNNAKYINIENLKGYNTSQYILRNWSFYQLQQYITYKAEQHGIEVRKINPCYTSQVCSVCGHWEEGQRKSQAVFECGNPDCESHSKYKNGFNADFNAARNIAKSTLFMGDGEVTEKSKQEAREYYGIYREED